MYIIYAIMGITIFMSYAAWKDRSKMQQWIFSAYIVRRDNSFYRFLTSGFIHADTTHLFVNMLTFYFFAPIPLRTFNDRTSWGLFAFLGLYLLGIIVSEIPSYFKYGDNPQYRSLGASGGVSSLLFSTILYRPDATFSIYFIFDVPALLFGVLYLIYSYYASKKSGNRINHSAHLWGALFGIAYTILIDPDVIEIFFNRMQNLF